MKVFWSWQNDYQPESNRHFIRGALGDAVKNASEGLGLEPAERPELDHDTKNTPGMAEITNTILKKINESAVFVADLTPIGETDNGKALPNPNVMIELGWALKALGPDRIIAIMNTNSGYTPDDLPFDVRHRRAMTYELAPSASKADRAKVRKGLTTELTEALKINLGQYVEEQAAEVAYDGAAAKDGDPSIWASCEGTFEYIDTSDRNGSVVVPPPPRAYIRIIPSDWKTGVPSVHDIQYTGGGLEVWPASEGTSSGDFGACEEGFARLWFTGYQENKQESANIVLWFDETGEFWAVHGTVVAEWKQGKKMLRVDSLIKEWRRTLSAAMRVLDHFGAHPARKVEVGIVGIKGVMWPTNYMLESSLARKKQTIFVRQQRNWSDSAQLEFLTEAYNKVRDNFALPHEDQIALKKITRDK